MTCKNPQPVLCRVLSQYFTTGVLSKLYCCSLVHSTNIIGMTGMIMNNWSFAVSSSPDENHCGMVTDTPSVLLTQYILHSLLVMEVSLQEHAAQQYNQRQPCWTRISSACTLHTLLLSAEEYLEKEPPPFIGDCCFSTCPDQQTLYSKTCPHKVVHLFRMIYNLL